MTSLTAISLAANIIQFVELGVRLLSEANQIHNSVSGLSEENVELQVVAQDLKSTIDTLYGAESSSLTVGSGFSSIASCARTIAEELIIVTQKLAVGEAGRKKWHCFRQALQTLWNKDKIENLKGRLDNMRTQISTHLLAQIRCEELQSDRKESFKEILDSLQCIQCGIGSTEIKSIQKVEEILNNAKLKLDTFDREQRILETLRFETMDQRYHTIVEAHRRTFDWIFRPSSFLLSDPRSCVYFTDWLRSGDGIYWISGKPGSGKSTLMKYIYDERQTVDSLRHWAKHNRLVTASFYFWAAGTGMQRTQRGLLQQLLFEVLRACPDLVSVLCPQRLSEIPGMDWSVHELEAAFEQLKSVPCNTHLCFFIDGLDEYEGDGLDLIMIIKNLARAENVKFCVSSRPLPCFENAFGNNLDTKIYLHQLTVDDITRFAQDKFEEIPGFTILRQERHVYADLVAEISLRAQGVFLWVFLVIRSLRERLINGDNLKLIRKRFDELPSDLELFFDKLIGSVDCVYKEQLAITLEVALRAPIPMGILNYWFLDVTNHHESYASKHPDPMEIWALEQRMECRLSGWYKGILEGTGTPGSRRVQFIHRTLRDYLEARDVSRLPNQPNLFVCTKAYKAIALQCLYRWGNVRSKECVSFSDFEFFTIFAKWAEKENCQFDWSYVEKMDMVLSQWYANYRLRFPCGAVRFGFIAYLEHMQAQDQTFAIRNCTILLRAVLETQLDIAYGIYGSQSSYNTLIWLLKHAADHHVQASFLEHLSRNRSYAIQEMRTRRSRAYKQWEDMLSILLRHGARANDFLAEPEFVKVLPQIGRKESGGFENLQTTMTKRDDEHIIIGLYKHLDIYTLLLKYGLEPNRYIPILKMTLWEMWLWHILEWQTDHGVLEAVCVRALKMFLDYGANPFQTVRFASDRGRMRSIWDVSEIVDSMIEDSGRDEIVPILISAKARWQQQHPEQRKRPLEEDESFQAPTHRRSRQDNSNHRV